MKDDLIRVTDSNFHKILRAGNRPYHSFVILNARNPDYGCDICGYVDDRDLPSPHISLTLVCYSPDLPRMSCKLWRILTIIWTPTTSRIPFLFSSSRQSSPPTPRSFKTTISRYDPLIPKCHRALLGCRTLFCWDTVMSMRKSFTYRLIHLLLNIGRSCYRVFCTVGPQHRAFCHYVPYQRSLFWCRARSWEFCYICPRPHRHYCPHLQKPMAGQNRCTYCCGGHSILRFHLL